MSKDIVYCSVGEKEIYKFNTNCFHFTSKDGDSHEERKLQPMFIDKYKYFVFITNILGDNVELVFDIDQCECVFIYIILYKNIF